jgi:hypothetical protein
MADDGGDDVPHEFMCPITKEVKNHIRKIKGKAIEVAIFAPPVQVRPSCLMIHNL